VSYKQKSEIQKKRSSISLSLFYVPYRYVLAAPKVLRVGASEKVVVQAFGYEEEFPVNIAIRSFPDKLAIYSSGHISLTPANKFQDAVTLRVRNSDFSCTVLILKFNYKC